MINKDDIKEGQHFWAISGDEILVIALFRNNFEVCGPWECGIGIDDFEIIELIEVPKGYESKKMYYV